MRYILEVNDISLSYHTTEGETAALSHLNFAIEPGEFVAIVGPSGCGKSTLLDLIAGLLTPEHGQILLEGKALADSSLNIGYMLQKDHLCEWRNIYRNITLGLEIRKKRTPERLDYVKTMMQTYGLWQFKDARPSQLSGGMRQRAALIRTLALNPALLLLDEPFSALDYQTRLRVSDDIGKILRREARTALLVTHDIAEAISMADRVLVLSARPATLKKNIPIELGISDRTPMSSRNASAFKTYFNLIWKELNT